MNEEILEAMAANDQTYEPDVDEDEDFLQSSNNFKRPVTADTGVETVRALYSIHRHKPRALRIATFSKIDVDQQRS